MTENETPNNKQTARDMGASLALQLLIQALLAAVADQAPDADAWRLQLSSTLKSQVLRSTAGNASRELLDSMAQSANDMLD